MKSGKTRTLILAIVLVGLLLCLTACQESTSLKYERANKLLTEGKYTEAAAIFDEISTYEDASKMSLYAKAINAAETNDYNTAFTTFTSLGEFKDCPMMITYYKGRQKEESVFDGVWIYGDRWFDAIEIYESIPLFRDSKERAENCRKAAYDQAIKSGDEGDASFAVSILKELGTYSDASKQVIYYQAVALQNQGDYSGASRTFSTIPGFRDADNRVSSVLEDGYNAASAMEEAGELDEANEIFLNLGEYKDSADRAYKLYCDAGLTMREEGKWDDARALFTKAGGYGDSEEQIKETTYQEAAALEASGNQEGAYRLFISLGDYSDSFERANKPYYDLGILKREAGEWDAARKAFSHAGDYLDAGVQFCEMTYQMASVLEDSGDQEGAYQLFISLGDYSNSFVRANKPYYDLGVQERKAGKWDDAISAFKHAGEYSDAVDQVFATYYAEGEAKRKAQDWGGARTAFTKAGEYSDAAVQISATYYAEGEAKRKAQDWEGARTAFIKAGEYSNAAVQISATYYAEGEAKRKTQDWEGARAAFTKAGEYSDAAVQISATYYAEGEAKRSLGNWDDARTAFEKAGEYLDAMNQISETTYQEAHGLLDLGRFDEAYDIFKSVKGYSDADSILMKDVRLATVRATRQKPYQTIGNYVFFGSYRQTSGSTNKTPIEWIVLDYDEANHKALLISRYGLDKQKYNNERVEITWEKCTLRAWLNNEFLIKAFSMEEQSAILETMVDNSPSQGGKWEHDGGKNTRDRVFLLSETEAIQYFSVKYDDNSNKKSRVAPTDYLIEQGIWTDKEYRTEDGKPASCWWLRTPKNYDKKTANAIVVNWRGGLTDYSLIWDSGVVRPAFWLNLESDIF